MPVPLIFLFFFFNDTATTEIYTLSLHDALPISDGGARKSPAPAAAGACRRSVARQPRAYPCASQIVPGLRAALRRYAAVPLERGARRFYPPRSGPRGASCDERVVRPARFPACGS